MEEEASVLDEALAVVHRTGERYYHAELLRLRGELFITHGHEPDLAQAEACFEESIRIAQSQKASSLELRAVMSLARLYQQQSKRDEARLLVSRVYDGFTEAFDTLDLLEAKALLDL
jgi:predicted ATPase